MGQAAKLIVDGRRTVWSHAIDVIFGKS
jgi:hypothetical protein